MAQYAAHLYATLTTLGVTAREKLAELEKKEDGLTALEYAILGGIVLLAVGVFAAILGGKLNEKGGDIGNL